MRRRVPTTEKRIDLDQRHGMAAQKATDLRVAIGHVRLTSTPDRLVCANTGHSLTAWRTGQFDP